MKPENTRIIDYGDSGVLVVFSESFNEEAWRSAHELAGQLMKREIAGILEVIPAYSSVFVGFDGLVADHSTIRAAIELLLERESPIVPNARETSRRFRIPVLFGGPRGPDLPYVADLLNLPENQVVELVCSKVYRIISLGSPVGLPLLDAPPIDRAVPRLESPRMRVPGGSLALGGRQATVYTLDSPGGWRLIGQTPVKFVDLSEDPPVWHRPGDGLEFYAIKEEEFVSYRGTTVRGMQVEV